MALSQTTRPLNIATVLGEDEIQLVSMSGDEELSRLYEYRLEMISENSAIQPEHVIGLDLTFSIDRADGEPRFFHGHVNGFSAGDENIRGHRSYYVTVVPWFWFFTQTEDCRIFQDMSVVQIIEEIFGELGLTDYELRLIAHHPKREYCVQYRETDFNFVSRLLEEEGIFYYFIHRNGGHKLVLGDHNNAWEECDESPVD